MLREARDRGHRCSGLAGDGKGPRPAGQIAVETEGATESEFCLTELEISATIILIVRISFLTNSRARVAAV